MTNLSIYSRNEQGLVSYQGEQEISLHDLLEYYGLSDSEPETERLLGWPHESVTWYGDLGVAQ